MIKRYNKVFFQDDDNSINSPVEESTTFDDMFNDLYDSKVEEVIEVQDELEVGTQVEQNDSIPSDEEESEIQGETREVSDTTEESEVEDSPSESVDREEVEEKVEDKSEVEELKEQVANLTSLIESLSSTKEQSVREPVQVDKVPEPVAEPLDLLDQFKDVDLVDVMDSKEGFLGFISQVMLQAEQRAEQRIRNSMPDVVEQVVSVKNHMTKVREQFYADNPALVHVQSYVGKVADEIAAEDPTLILEDVLKETASRVKKTLGLKDIEVKTEAEVEEQQLIPEVKTERKPVLPGAQGGPRQKVVGPTNSLQGEIDEFLSN